ncbi:hypothetical protein KR054_009639 [Drosophila jambulina]|nr:hypothetical protein KR054_009639 [Drosophila jambulina]
MDSDCEAAAAAALADDSGHFSCVSGDESGADPDQTPIPEREKSMFLLKQELLKSRSEVERLLKSEHWYKQELKSQKHSRLETLERLYAQERKYLVENQRLQQESMRLHAKCATLEKQQEQESPKHPTTSSPRRDASPNASFEAKQQEARLRDQRQLIDVLRKQKKMLLEDIQRLSLEHDEKLGQLQQNLAGMELESKLMTGRCKQLLDDKSQMEHQLELRSSALRSVNAEREQLRQVIAELNETLQTQEQLLALKEQEFLDLKQYYQQKLTRESSVDVMHSYSLKFHEEINSKTSEIAGLKNSLNELRSELLMMSQLKEQNEEQQRQLEQLKFALQAQLLEQEQLRQSDALKLEQVESLTISLASLQLEKESLKENLLEARKTLHKLEQEVHRLRGQYDEMRSMCEETQRQLEKEQGDLEKFKEQSSLNESDLIDKLNNYAALCEQLKADLAAAETQIHEQSQQAKIWQQKLKTIEESPKQEVTQCQNKTTQTEVEVDPILIQRIETLEHQLADVKAQKKQTVSLLQQLLQQQDAKIKSTSDMEADWTQLLEALQATQQLEQEMRAELQHKTLELEQLNELFAGQNEELQQLQQLGLAKDEENRLELQLLKETFQENLENRYADSKNIQMLQGQVKSLLDEREESSRQEHKAVDCLRSLAQVLEMETGRKLQHIKCWPQLAKLIRKELRIGRVSHRKAEELPGLKLKLAEVSGMHEQALARIKTLEQTLAAEKARYEASDSGKSTYCNARPEPAHEVANLIDDYKKLVQQTARETGRPSNSFILELIERSQRCQPNLCELSEGVTACCSDVEQLSWLLNAGRDQTRAGAIPSLMEELRAVAEHS